MHHLITDHSSNSQWLNSLNPQNKSKKQYVKKKKRCLPSRFPKPLVLLAATTVTCPLKHFAGISYWRKQPELITEKSSWNFYLFLWALGSVPSSLSSNNGVIPLHYFSQSLWANTAVPAAQPSQPPKPQSPWGSEHTKGPSSWEQAGFWSYSSKIWF